MATIKKALVVVNPIAGGDEKQEQLALLKELEGVEITLFETSGKNDLKLLQQSLQKNNPNVLVALGGDGTVHLAAEALQSSPDIPLSILPAGSGNGLSKDLEIPQNIKEALPLISGNYTKAIDVLLLNGKLCIHLADLGFNALVVKKFDEANTRGPGTYARIALAEIAQYKPACYEIITDTTNYTGEAFMITVTNANKFGSDVPINPEGILNDGVFEITVIKPFPVSAAPGLLYDLYTAGVHNSDYAEVLKCSKATILNPGKAHFQIDGEPQQATQKIEIELKPKALNVLLPNKPNNLL